MWSGRVRRPYFRSVLSTGSELQYQETSLVNAVFGGIFIGWFWILGARDTGQGSIRVDESCSYNERPYIAIHFQIGAFQYTGYKDVNILQAHFEVIRQGKFHHP